MPVRPAKAPPKTSTHSPPFTPWPPSWKTGGKRTSKGNGELGVRIGHSGSCGMMACQRQRKAGSSTVRLRRSSQIPWPEKLKPQTFSISNLRQRPPSKPLGRHPHDVRHPARQTRHPLQPAIMDRRSGVPIPLTYPIPSRPRHRVMVPRLGVYPW